MTADGDMSSVPTRRGDPATDPSKCGYYKGRSGDWHRNKRGGRCGQNVVAGTEACRSHAGRSLAEQRAKGAVVVELRRWGLNGHTELADPGETLLRLVTQSAARVELYADLVRQAYEAADRLRAAQAVPDGEDLLAEETARLDLERILNHGAVGALVGHTYSGTQQNGVIATGEKIRGLVQLEAEERDRLAGFCAKAIAAGLAAKMVEAYTRLGEQFGSMLLRVVERAALSDEARRALLGEFAVEMTQVTGVPYVIEGQAAA